MKKIHKETFDDVDLFNEYVETLYKLGRHIVCLEHNKKSDEHTVYFKK